MKELTDTNEEDVYKEAKFLNKLCHENIVNFMVLYMPEKSIMMEFMEFDLTKFGLNITVNSLDGLLRKFHRSGCIEFEHIVPLVSRGVVNGLEYLRNQGVAHRDLKPSNILISNSKFNYLFKSMSDDEKKRMWIENPCVVKLTDFGEASGNIAQTTCLARSRTLMYSRVRKC